MATFKHGDTAPIAGTARDANGAVALSGATAELRLTTVAGDETILAATPDPDQNANRGRWTSADPSEVPVGYYRGVLHVTFADGTVRTFPSAGYETIIIEDASSILSPETVRAEAARLMAYRLRVGAFSTPGGGTRLADFTDETTPSLAAAVTVTTRQAALTANDFPWAKAGDEPELRTIAALRSAIELESSAPNMDEARIRVWRDELREYVGRVGTGPGEGEAEPGGGDSPKAVWSFDGTTADVQGSEIEWETATLAGTDPPRRRLVW